MGEMGSRDQGTKQRQQAMVGNFQHVVGSSKSL
ncbi:hypothetical protein LINGRAHAP2_LOCUS22498 [Linum grandiflorum]